MSKTLEEVREIFSAAQKIQQSLQPQMTKEKIVQNQKSMITPDEMRARRLSQPKTTLEEVVEQVSKSLGGQKSKSKGAKCDCGHYSEDHHNGEGWCHSSTHKNPGKCGCTFYHPNVKSINKKNK